MISKFFIRRPIFAIVISLIISILGLIALGTLPVAKYPNVTPPQVRVFTRYMGANAEVINATVASVLEKQLSGIDHLVSIESMGNDMGLYSLQAQFEPGSNVDMDVINMQNRIQQIAPLLPQEVAQAGISVQKSTTSMAMVFALVSPHGTYDPIFMKNYASQYFLDTIKSIPGVGNVQEFGSDYAMRIWLNPMKMGIFKVTPMEVVNALRTQNAQAAVGMVGAQPGQVDGIYQYPLRANGRLQSVDEFKHVVIKTNPDGSPIYVGDIASVQLGAQDYSMESNVNGHPAMGFMVSLTSDANAMQTVGEIKKVLEKEQARFPDDMNYKIIYDSTVFVKASIEEVLKTFVEALLLVALIVFLFLQNARSTLIPLIAVPVSLLGTFACFTVLGFSINTLTLFAMVLAIGLLVDDAIVVIEAVVYEMKYHNRTPREATYIAMENVQKPVIGVACVLAAVFVPVAFLGGMSGVLYRQFALTIAVSVGISAWVALTLTPALCPLLLRPHEKRSTPHVGVRFFIWFNDRVERLINAYGKRLAQIKNHLRLSLVVLVVISGLTAMLFISLPKGFVPPEDNGFVILNMTLPEGMSQEETQKVGAAFSKWVQQQPGVANMLNVVGFSVLAGGPKANGMTSFIGMEDWKKRPGLELSSYMLVGKIMKQGMAVPEANVLAMNPPPIDGMGTSSGFSLQIENRGGHTIAELGQTAQQFLEKAKERPEIAAIFTAFTSDTPGYELMLDRQKIAREGVNLKELYQTLQIFYGSYQVNDFMMFGRNFKVFVQAASDYRGQITDLSHIFVRDKQGNMVPIQHFVTPSPMGSASIITRFNNYPAIKLQGMPAKGYSSGDALQALREVAQQTLGEGYAYEWSGMSREEVEAGNKTTYIFALALLFVFLILAALYESFKVPFAVLLSVPTGLFGASLFAYVLHLQNNIYFQIGILAVIGLSAKNAILIIEYAKVRVEERGMDIVSAVIEAAKIRIRPIVMTSLAFIFGAIPLIMASGAGASSRITMGITVVCGTSMATILGIFFIPLLFIIVQRIKIRI
ncbi:hydrophobe/amphiphile efflux-1 family RND transporter [Veillonellaceae bacterium M2-4]|nr:hydrophobe/amphiphile efflux-1 family RND transporter [Veillonellaceae bacterium M2-4]